MSRKKGKVANSHKDSAPQKSTRNPYANAENTASKQSPWPSAPPERKKANLKSEQPSHEGNRGGRSRDSKKPQVDDKVWTGIVSAHPDGFGFVNVQGREEDVFLSVDEMRDVMHGDQVEVQTFQRRGREAGKLLRIVKMAASIITAEFKIEHGLGFAHPRSKRMPQSILIPREHSAEAKHEDWVRVDIERGSNPLRGKIIEVLGDDLTPKKLVDLIIAEQALSESFPPAVLLESEAIPERIRVKEKKDRLDLTHLPFVTIDGEDARDFDDAICVQPRGEGFEAWVAIADVAHYVPVDSALDVEAQTRGNSFYFPDRVIPMLPEKLSNGLCSLNPDVPRLAMVVRMRFDAGGKRRSSHVYNGLIHSQARLTYEQAASWLEQGDTSSVALEHVREMLICALGLYHVLERNRGKRGALEIELPEVRAVIEGDAVCNIESRERNVAHKLIEEMMLAANTAVAKFIEDKKCTQLYRIHPAPERDSIEKLNAFLSTFGLKIRQHARDDVRPQDVQQVLAAAEGKPFAHILQRLVLRSMQQAKYTTENVGHFGLAYDCYGHFTSPIRRYADLTTHRQLKGILAEEKIKKQDLESIGAHISSQERIQQRAEWDTQAMLAALYHQQDVGKVLQATVSGVSKRRVFFTLSSSQAEAALNIDTLGKVFTLDEVHHRLHDKSGSLSLGLGDTFDIEITSTDPVRGLINIVLAV
ncbi:MAG: ribonuclease R [Mariprofundaceae bacterium]|nr:ribonuclease R [Mariprofundaceae bacterium]